MHFAHASALRFFGILPRDDKVLIRDPYFVTFCIKPSETCLAQIVEISETSPPWQLFVQMDLGLNHLPTRLSE